mgnify:FL=1
MYQELRECGDVCARILAQNQAIIRELVARLKKRPPSIIVTCARGSSDHAASFAKTIFETKLGIMVVSYAPSMSTIFETKFRNMENALFIVISQSGKSPDLLASLRAAKESGALCVAIVNDTTSPVAALADFVLPMQAGVEKSVAATKSYIASLLVLCDLLAHWQSDDEFLAALQSAPQALDLAANLDWGQAIASLSHATNMFVIGRGLTFGIAGEAALKLKETSSIHAEAFSAAEVRHGPMALVKAKFPVLMFVPMDATRTGFDDLIHDFARRNAHIFVASGDYQGAMNLPTMQRLHPIISPIAQIQSFYSFAEEMSRARGFDPDAPPYLQKVTETK